MTWQEVVALVAEQEAAWFLGPIGLAMAAVILIWVWRNKRNGGGKEERLAMVEKDVAVIKEGVKGMQHWVDQSIVTQTRTATELGELRGALNAVLAKLDKEPTDPPRH